MKRLVRMLCWLLDSEQHFENNKNYNGIKSNIKEMVVKE
jgi:hypothetical protein